MTGKGVALPEGARAAAPATLPVRNAILTALPAAERQKIQPSLRRVMFAPGETVSATGVVKDCLFIDSGVVSLLCEPDGMSPVEVGMVGSEGMLGLAVVLGTRSRIHAATALTECSAWRIGAADLARAVDRSSVLHGALLHYASVRLAESMKRSACHLQHCLEPRVADWILAATDRLGSMRIAITHQQLSTLLGATRPGVTLAIQELEGRHAIRARRNLISVRSRDALGAISCGCHGLRLRGTVGILARAAPRPERLPAE
jgi:CRP-like cAMP-binding protein